jgi:hypothetical protein
MDKPMGQTDRPMRPDIFEMDANVAESRVFPPTI